MNLTRIEPVRRKLMSLHVMSLRVLASATATLILACAPAYACRYHKPIEIDDLRYADLILVGRISNFRTVSPDREPGLKTAYPRVPFAEFEISAEEVLFGTAPERVIVTSYPLAGAQADQVSAGPFLFALREPLSEFPPRNITGREALFYPNAVDGSFTILGQRCSSVFMFEPRSNEAESVRRFLAD